MFYGWRIVAGTFISQLFVVGFFTYAASLLIPSVRAEFDVSLEQVMYGMTIGTLLGLVASPLAGALVDRVSVRILMAGGIAAFGIGTWAMSRSETITQYIWLFGLTMSAANCFAATIPAMAVVSRWFTASRGKALGIAAIGTSLGGALLPVVLDYWIEAQDWRYALHNLALMLLLGALPAVIFLIRGYPEDVGLTVEGGVPATPTEPVAGSGAAAILKNPGFWFLGFSLAFTMAAYSAILANLTPYAVTAGYTEAAGSKLIVTVAILGLIGKIVFGTAADRFDLKLGLWGAQLFVVVGFILLALEPPFWGMLLGAGAMGLAAGGFLPVWGAMMARIFGLGSYGTAMGLMTPLITLCVMPTFIVVGRMVDSSGSFQSPLLMFVGVMVLAILFLLPLRVPVE